MCIKVIYFTGRKVNPIKSNPILLNNKKSLEIRIAPNVFSIGEKMTDEGNVRKGGIRMSIGFVWP